jgi:hypothetical protein
MPQSHCPDSNPGTLALFRKCLSPVLPVQSCISIELSALCRPLCSLRIAGSGGLLTWSQKSSFFLLVSCFCHLSFQAARTFCFSVKRWCVGWSCLNHSSCSLFQDSLCSFIAVFLLLLRPLLLLILALIQLHAFPMTWLAGSFISGRNCIRILFSSGELSTM